MLSVTIAGDRALDKKLRNLAGRAASRARVSAVRAGMREIARGIRREAPVGKTKRLKKSIGAKVAKAKRGPMRGITEARAGVDVGKKKNQQAPHSHLVALGTGPRTTKDGSDRGSMPPNDFVKRGFAKTQSSARSKMMVQLAKEIDKAARKK